MSRASEIEKEAKNKYPYIKGLPQTVAHQEIFIEGAKWADSTMIDKVCEWLENNVNNYIIIDDYLGKVQPKISSSMFDNFKKAMEG